MRQVISLSVLLAIAKADAVDCSGAAPWKAQVYDSNTLHNVHYQGNLYTQQWWASETDIPTAGGPWLLKGACIAGTAGDADLAAGPEVDCGNVALWSGTQVYAEEKKYTVQHKGRTYINNYWTQSNEPGSGQEWIPVGVCKSGTGNQGDGKEKLPAALEDLLCSCCKGCAQIQVTGPVCMDVPSDACFFTDCSTKNLFNEAKCEDVKARQQLNFYRGEILPGKKDWPKKKYVPYFDAGLYPFPQLSQIQKEHGINYFVGAFIVAPSLNFPVQECSGKYAGVIPFEVGPTTWNGTKGDNDYIYDLVNEVRANGGDVTISFGGAMNTELADSDVCQQGDAVANLVKAYSEVIDFLKLTHIDFDIEGAAVSAAVHRDNSWGYRFEAVKQLVQKYPGLEVWWTLPILPQGLTDDGLAFIEDMMKADAPWDIFNVMNMDYGDDTTCPGNQMHACEVSAIENLAKQFYSTAQQTGKLSQYGWTSPDDVYPKLGSTVMIGMNDVTTEIYTLEDAKASLEEWKTKKPLGLISNWSVARDQPCKAGATTVDCGCSTLASQTAPLQFADIFKAYESS